MPVLSLPIVNTSIRKKNDLNIIRAIVTHFDDKGKRIEVVETREIERAMRKSIVENIICLCMYTNLGIFHLTIAQS